VSETPDLELLVLTVLDQVDGPVGSGAVCDWLRQQGATISEATAGRYLRELDHKGFTQRAGFRGRALTPSGHERLTELRRERAAAASSNELVSALRASGLQDLIDVLVARRALEREIVLLAATRVEERDLEAMDTLLQRYETVDSSAAAAEADFAFHERLAEVAGNKVLQAAAHLILSEAHANPIPAGIQRRMRPVLARQHRAVLEALRAHDAARAEAAMVNHLDELIEAVERYWKQ